MDRITKSLLNEFAFDWGLIKDETVIFENFANYIILSREYRQTFELEEVYTGEGGDTAIDGLAIIVNGKLVGSTEEVDDLINTTGYLDVDIIFTQSKTTSSFEGSEIGNFIFGVKDFISEKPGLVQNIEIQNYLEIWEHILSKSSDMVRRRPNCKMYYVTTGKWLHDKNLTTIIDGGIEELKNFQLFENISFIPCGALEIHQFYRDTKNKLTTTVNFVQKITLPEIDGIAEAFFGLLPFSEFKKLIVDENNNILNVFYDNIRDFQGPNPVNKGIQKTLTDKQYDLFCVLNNGVTIVASSLTPAGNKFTLRDYQIVNGCQTSHVLYKNSDLPGVDSVLIPVRIVVTNNEQIKNHITLATNSQTEVKPEQLAAQTRFQKELEQYYSSILGPERLYYERRSQQYHLDPTIKKTQIITIPLQIKAFTSMFLQAPHSVSGYYGTIVKKHERQLFVHDHSYGPYYTSGLAYFMLESLFRNATLDKKYKKAKFQLLMIFRIISNDDNTPPMNSKKMEEYCQKINAVLNNPIKCGEIFEESCRLFENVGLDMNQRQYKSEAETTQILTFLKTHH